MYVFESITELILNRRVRSIQRLTLKEMVTTKKLTFRKLYIFQLFFMWDFFQLVYFMSNSTLENRYLLIHWKNL